MNEHGYLNDDHDEGWRLLQRASGGGASGPIYFAPAAAAVRELDDGDEILFHKAHAALRRSFPAQADFVFAGLEPARGPAAVLSVLQLLDRLDVLESGGRPDSQDADKEAIAELAKRGMGATERARLRELVRVAQSSPIIPAEANAKAAELESQRVDALKALYAWYAQWSEVARAVVTRRGDLVLLGMAKRRGREDGSEGPATVGSVGESAHGARAPVA